MAYFINKNNKSSFSNTSVPATEELFTERKTAIVVDKRLSLCVQYKGYSRSSNQRNERMSDVRRLRSQTGPANPSLLTQPCSQTLPRDPKKIKTPQKKHSKDDLDIPKPYLINGPVRRAPLPPGHRQKKEENKRMPRRAAPPPPSLPSKTLQSNPTVKMPCSTMDNQLDDIYEIPEKATDNTRHSSSLDVKKKKCFPPPVPTSPRPLLSQKCVSHLNLDQCSITEKEEEGTESIYEETNCQPPTLPPSTGTADPTPPPLPPRTSSTVLQPPKPPLSQPPPSKPPAPDPTIAQIPLRPPKGIQIAQGSTSGQEEDDDLYTEMSSIVKELGTQQHQENDDEYICMGEAIMFRNQFTEKEKSIYTEMNTNSILQNQTSEPVAIDSQPSIQSYSDNENEQEEYTAMDIPSGSYVKMICDKLITSGSVSVHKAPPIPPKPILEPPSQHVVERKPRTIPRQKMSAPHMPPPSPPHDSNINSLMEGSTCSYEPVSCKPTEKETDNQIYEPVSVTEELYV